jgi:hypothetical protein
MADSIASRMTDTEWAPTREDYKRLETHLIELMMKQHEQGKVISVLCVLWIITVIFVGFKVLFG